MSKPEFSHTPGPWRWQKFGAHWVLVGAHSDTPIILDFGFVGDGPKGGTRNKQLRVCVGGVMRQFSPAHPDATLIAAAPDLLLACERAVHYLKEHCSIYYTNGEIASWDNEDAKDAHRDILAAIQKALAK